MKSAIVTLISCLIAVSRQQHYPQHQQANINPYWPLPLHQHRQQQPFYYQEPHQNYPSYNYPYYRGPYSPSTQPIYPDYYQPQQQQQVPKRSQGDEITLMALLSQLNQQQQPQQQQKSEKQDSRQKELDLDLLNQLNKDSVFIAQHQDIDSPPTDQQSVQQIFSNDENSSAANEEESQSMARTPIQFNEQDSQAMARTPVRFNEDAEESQVMARNRFDDDDSSQAMARAPIRFNEEDSQGRTPFGFLKKKQNYQMENRGILPALLFGAQLFATSTKYTFITSTITSTNVLSCIASGSFYGGSTQACRRKRSVAEIEADEDQMMYKPSPVNSVEPSAIYDELSLSHHRQPRSAQLISSFEQSENGSPTDDTKMSSYDSFVRVKRFGSTITTTVTTYAISVTASKKTVTIGSSLSCLPSGYSVC